ncbi:MAG TPA: hypothetical protein VN643_14075, partial [Pyrinomonadaceae bacterium]|nr:hypothetical protein [Pyrinomonadaceae bacterium]
KLCAKNAPSFPQLPQPLLLILNKWKNEKKKPLFFAKGLDIHIAVDRASQTHSTPDSIKQMRNIPIHREYGPTIGSAAA